MEDRQVWKKYNEDRYLAALKIELSIGNRFFYCSSVHSTQLTELVAMWKQRIVEMQEGESACIVLCWSAMSGGDISVPILEGLKAIKQEGRIIFYTIFAVDPLLDGDEDWLWVFSDSDGSLFSRIWGTGEHIAEYSMQELIDLPIYKGSSQ